MKRTVRRPEEATDRLDATTDRLRPFFGKKLFGQNGEKALLIDDDVTFRSFRQFPEWRGARRAVRRGDNIFDAWEKPP
jgi:hypothetical protein